MTIAGSMLIIAQACTESKGNHPSIPKQTDPIPVKVVALEKSTSDPEIITSGKLTTDDETTLAFKVGGVVHNVLVKEGDYVRKGQTLATLELTEIDAVVSQARFAFEKAERDLRRTENLYKDSVATLEQLQNAQTGLDLASAQYNSAKFNRSFSEIKAPASGYVLRKFVNAGQVVSPGDPVVRTNGAGNGKWILKTGASDKQWASIRINDKATIQLDAFPDVSFEGEVIRKAEAADPATGSFTIEIAVNQGDKRFGSGMFAAAKIMSGGKIDSWNVPYEAVLDANGNDGFVFITNDKQKAIRKPVVIESFNGKTIQVTKGLEDAEAIIVSGSAYLSDNSPIVIVN